ncbi:MAG TPA: sodium:solute symporter, partial [Chitinophagaceae bacterium]|nr:sodium:solute symporter [Chitinophagaceae bacterium]
IGVLLFAFYQFKPQPIFFNPVQEQKLLQSNKKDSAILLQNEFDKLNTLKTETLKNYSSNKEQTIKTIHHINDSASRIKNTYINLFNTANIEGDKNDTNYIFLRFVVDYLPVGLVGLIIAIIFLAAWGSIAAALNSLAACTIIDFHKRFSKKKMIDETEQAIKDYRYSKIYTLLWGIFCIVIAETVVGMGSLIEAVNVLGSLFYGVILGIFLVGFYIKKVKGNAVFVAAIISEIAIIGLFVLDKNGIIGLGFLWLNVVGALLVMLLSFILQYVIHGLPKSSK